MQFIVSFWGWGRHFGEFLRASQVEVGNNWNITKLHRINNDGFLHSLKTTTTTRSFSSKVSQIYVVKSQM